MIKVVHHLASKRRPLGLDDLLTESKGQVREAQHDKYLAAWRFSRRLGAEGGRTNRGAVAQAEDFLDFVLALELEYGVVDHFWLMAFWLRKARDFFNSQPIVVKIHDGQTTEAFLRSAVSSVRERERKLSQNKTIIGTFMQHMFGASLALGTAPGIAIDHHKANKSDAQTGRRGDFEIGDTVYHVTSAPKEALIAKCVDDSAAGRLPVIITLDHAKPAAILMADNANARDLIEVVGFEARLAACIDHLNNRTRAGRRTAIDSLVTKFNGLVETVEGDPGLKLLLA